MDDKKMDTDNYYLPPEKKGGFESFAKFLYNAETGQIIGRTPSSWAKILVFYTIFYIVLSIFFGILMFLFYQTLDYKIPKWQLDKSLIGTNPGLGFRPMPPESHVDSTLIWFKQDPNNYKYWTNELDNFLEKYRDVTKRPGQGQNIVKCDYGVPRPPGKVCDIDMNRFGPCKKENSYSYGKGTPCIFLKLNKIFNWQPEFYNDTNKLPEKMPNDLKNDIKQSISQNAATAKTVWVSCEGENPADVENMGTLSYYPWKGFPGYFFPFQNTEGYLAPVIAVHFESPAIGVLINIECKAWAHNIHHDRHERRGSVHFELMID
ncbi:hypothetical protein M8J76_006835 [Diaphorina citri]|nr:hypothetical protein M8J75_003553 [Diaphorina citri]KAI5736764.1 hypothetical protein M8J76_006835 [Diaphorina citri]